jgi:hypothetical protein
VIDQWAHGAGLVIGALAGGLLSPHARWAKHGLRVARVVTLSFAALAVMSALLVTRTSIANSLEDAPRALHHVGDFTVKAPASWQESEGDLYDADHLFELSLDRATREDPLDAVLSAYVQKNTDELRSQTDQVDVATDVIVPLPSQEWRGRELVVSHEDPLGGRQRARVVVAGHQVGDHVVLASLALPEMVARKAPAFFTRLLDSIAEAKR